MSTLTYKVSSIDAWGNSEDGWEQNDYFPCGTLEIPEEASDTDILVAMVDAGYLTMAKGAALESWGERDFNVIDAETGEPLFSCMCESEPF